MIKDTRVLHQNKKEKQNNFSMASDNLVTEREAINPASHLAFVCPQCGLNHRRWIDDSSMPWMKRLRRYCRLHVASNMRERFACVRATSAAPSVILLKQHTTIRCRGRRDRT